MRYKPDVVKKAKFEYSPLGQVFDKGLKTDERQEALLKRLINRQSEKYRSLLELFKAIYYRNITIEKAERMQQEFDAIIGALENINQTKK